MGGGRARRGAWPPVARPSHTRTCRGAVSYLYYIYIYIYIYYICMYIYINMYIYIGGGRGRRSGVVGWRARQGALPPVARPSHTRTCRRVLGFKIPVFVPGMF